MTEQEETGLTTDVGEVPSGAEDCREKQTKRVSAQMCIRDRLLHHGSHHGTASLKADKADGHGHGVFRRQHAHRQGRVNAAERGNARREDDASLAKEPHDIRRCV